MRRRVVPTPLVLAAFALLFPLAGCANPSGAEAVQAVQATPTTGILHGVVVDAAIRPLANVTVAIGLADGTERSQGTLDDGAGRFGDRAPGAYVVRAHRLGYFDAQVWANVTAGRDDPEGVRVVLDADAASVPAVDAYLFDGFLQCSVTFVAVRAAACNPSEAGVCGLPIDLCTTVPGNLTDDRFMAVHTIGRGAIAFLQSEMQWQASSGLGSNLRAVPGSRPEGGGAISDFRPFEGPSPLVMPMDGAIANGLFIGNGKDYVVRVFSGYMDGTAPPCLPSPAGCQWGVGFAYQQRFNLITHAFYGFTPPEGWEFGRDGLPPVPA